MVNLYLEKTQESSVEKYDLDHYVEDIEAITGQLMMVDFKDYSARIDNDKQGIACTFDDDTENGIAGFLQKSVYAVGISTRSRADNTLAEFHIKLLVVMQDATPTTEMLAALAAYRAENDTRENLRRGFMQALNGETRSMEDIWSELNVE